MRLLFALPALACSAYWALALYAARKKLREPIHGGGYAPPVSILKPIRGRDDGFYDSIASHARLRYPSFEILFGVRDPLDPALADIERLIGEFPDLPIRVIRDAPDPPNGKVGMLISLAAAATHNVLLVNDSDILVGPDYLSRVIAPLADPAVGLVTCLYSGRGQSFPTLFEALGLTVEFIPGVLVARTVGVIEFAMGSTMAFRREQLFEIGGFEAIAGYLADDYQLGLRISKTGRRVVISSETVETNLGSGGWREVWKHQVRWARTVRVSRRAGYVASVVTHATTWALVALAAGAWPVALLCLLLRFAAAAAVARLLRQHHFPWVLVPFRDLASTAVWAAGLAGSHVEWRGHKLKLLSEGRLAAKTDGASGIFSGEHAPRLS